MKKIYTYLLLILTSYANALSQKVVALDTQQKFTLPSIPAMYVTPEERSSYLVTHYWDNYDFVDTTLISKPQITEQALVDFINILPYAMNYSEGVDSLLTRSLRGSQQMFDHFANLLEKYLYDPNSPMRNEEFYIPVLNHIIANQKLDEIYKIRPRYQLDMAMKNRPGDIAADFVYTRPNGQREKLSQLDAEYTILFFNNPSCFDCVRVKDYMAGSLMISKLLSKERNLVEGQVSLAILAIYPDGDLIQWKKTNYPKFMINGYDAGQKISNNKLYDLKAIPSLYLLNKEKRVVLKDVTIEQIESWLMRLQ